MNSLCLFIVDGRNHVLKHLGKKSVKMPQRAKGQIEIYKALHGKLTIELHEPH
jgi:hypothetical protein